MMYKLCIGTMTVYQYPLEKQSVQSIGVQCDLLAAPPLTKFSKLQKGSEQKVISDPEDTDLTDQRVISDPEDTDFTDLDASFQISQEDSTTE